MASVGHGGTPRHVDVEFCAREEELAGGGGSRLRAGDGEGQRGGSAFIGGRLWHTRKGSGADSAPSIHGRRWPSIRAAPSTAARKGKRGVGEEKESERGRLTGGTRGQ